MTNVVVGVGDEVESRDGFEGTVTGYGEPYNGQVTLIVKSKGGKVNTYQPELLKVTKAAPGPKPEKSK